MAKILLIEDDETLSEVVQAALETQGHTVDAVTDGIDGLDRLKHFPHDVAIVDWELPRKPGVEIIREFRSGGGSTPIIMLTGKNRIEDKSEGFDVGADDYLTKPFEMDELKMRVRSLLRRPPVYEPEVLKVGDIELDTVARVVRKGGVEIDLVPKEMAILEFLMRNPNQVFNVETITARLWSSESDVTPETVRPYITRLRSKLQSGKSELIRTVYGMGYKLVAD